MLLVYPTLDEAVVGYDSNGEAVNTTIDSPVIDEIAQTPSFTVTKEADVIHVGEDDASAPVYSLRGHDFLFIR